MDTLYEPFIQHMRNRLPHVAASAALSESTSVPRMTLIVQMIRLYADVGDTRFLIDIANLAMAEFKTPENPKAHYAVVSSV